MANGEMQQAPGAPQGGPQQAPGGPEGQGGEGRPSLPEQVMRGMQAVGSALEQSNAPREILETLAQSMQLYGQVLDAISGGGQAGPQGNEPSPRPVNTQGTVAGPQG